MTTEMHTPLDTSQPIGGDSPSFGEEKRRQTQRRYKRWAIFSAIGVVVAIIAVWIFSSGDDEQAIAIRPEDTPLIQAPDTPFKTAPDAPGGMQVPHRDKFVYDRLERITKAPGVERLLPPPEQPLAPPQPDDGVSATDGTASTAPGLPPLETREIPLRPGLPAPPDQPAEQPQENPQDVEAVAVMPFRTPPPKPARAPAPRAAAQPAPATSPPPSRQAVPPGEGYLIQLIAVSSQQQAAGAWDQLQRQNPAILGNLTPVISRVDVSGGRVLYRVRAGAFGTVDSAQAACSRLIARNVDCVLVRPGG